MSVARHSLSKVIAERTMHVSDTDKLAKEVAAYLLAEGRTADLESVIRDVMQYRAEKGQVEVIAVSAHELDDETIREIKDTIRRQFPNADKIIVSRQHDPEVVGGIQIKLANQQLDMTIRSKLDTFKRLTTSGKE